MNKSLAPALSNGLYLIELISRQKNIGFHDLEQQSGLNPSTLNRLLKTLIDQNYIQKNNNGQYILGTKMFIITQQHSIWKAMLHIISPVLEDLKNTFGVTALIYERTPQGFIVIDKRVHPENIAMREIGELKPDYILSPWGYLHLATLSETEVESIYKSCDKPNNANIKTPTLTEIKEQISFIKTNKYADDRGTIMTGIRRIAAPIYHSSNVMSAALAVGSITTLLTEKDIKQISAKLIKHSDIISQIMQGNDLEK